MFKPISKSDDKQQKISKLVIYISKFSRALWKRFEDPQWSADQRLRTTVLKCFTAVFTKHVLFIRYNDCLLKIKFAEMSSLQVGLLIHCN